MNLDINALINQAVEMIMNYGPKLVLALVVLILGLKIINLIVHTLLKKIDEKTHDKTLETFFGSLMSWTLKVMLFISVASMLGIETTSFVAVLGAAGLAVGLALQGTLANLAGGVLCLVFRPYKIGDLVNTQGELGTVKDIQVFTTTLLSPDNKTITIPNGAIMNGNIINYSKDGKIRVDLIIGVAYDSDLKKTKEVLFNVMKNDPNVLAEPVPFVGVDALADSSVNMAVKPWTKPEHFWDVYFSIQESCKIALDEADITIPFPQRDIHVINSSL